MLRSRRSSPRLETVIVMLAGDAPVAKMEKYSGMIAHLTVGRQILERHRRNAKPIHLQCNPVAVAKNISDRVSLALKKFLTAFGSLEGFGKIGRRSMRCSPVRHFLYGHVLCKKPGERFASRSVLNRANVFS